MIFFVFIFVKLNYGIIIADSMKKIAEQEVSQGLSIFRERKKTHKNEIIKAIFISFMVPRKRNTITTKLKYIIDS